MWHVYEYHTMHYFGNPGHIESMIESLDYSVNSVDRIYDRVFLEIPVKNYIVDMLLTCTNYLHLLADTLLYTVTRFFTQTS